MKKKGNGSQRAAAGKRFAPLEKSVEEELAAYIDECMAEGEWLCDEIFEAPEPVAAPLPFAAYGAGNLEDELDDVIRQFSIGWDISRISKLARCILRLAIYEILYVDDVPTGVAVAEAVRIAKKYDGDDTGAFINGILGSFVRSRNTETEAPQEEAK